MSAEADRSAPLVLVDYREYQLGSSESLMMWRGMFTVTRNGVLDASRRIHFNEEADWAPVLVH